MTMRNLFLGFMCLFSLLSAGNYDHQLAVVSNLVAELDDSSLWKVDPNYAKIFASWQPGEHVHVSVRTESFWFKPDYICILCNHERNEKVFAMPLKTPWSIDFSEGPCYANNIWFRTISLDNYQETQVECSKSDTHFVEDAPAYIGYQEDNGAVVFYIICGVGTKTVWGRALVAPYYFVD